MASGQVDFSSSVKRSLNDQKGHFMHAEGSKRAHLLSSFPSPPPPPTHTHTPKRFYIPCLFIVFAPLPIQHSFLCSFKWMSLLKPVPQPKKILYLMFPVHLYDLCSSQNLALFCSLISKKMSLFPQNAWEEICQKGNKCYCNSLLKLHTL